MDIDQIDALVQIVTGSSVAEVTVRTPERRITVRRTPATQTARAITRAPARRAVGARHLALEGGAEAPVDSLLWITSPLVGIYYHAEPPITVGIEIQPGQVVGVVESMKLMNEVRSDHGGIVVESAIEAGMAVEFGQPLFAVREPQGGEPVADSI